MFLPDPSGHRDVALALARESGRVLLVRNARSAQGLAVAYWDLPGGTVEPGEPLEAALLREVEEETGLHVTDPALVLVVDGAKRRAPDAPPLYTWRAFVFEVKVPFGAIPVAGDEIERVEWVRDADAFARMEGPYQAPVIAWMRGPERKACVRCDWVEPEPDGASPLPAEVRHLCVLAAAAAVGDVDLVAREARDAIAAGVPAARVEEALLQGVPYAGFPRTLAAFAALRAAGIVAAGPAPAAAAEAPPSTFAAAGAEAFGAVYGPTADRVRAGLASFHPLLPAWTTEFAYGRVLARPALPLVERELLAVALLTALGRADDALLGHMRAAVRLGASPVAVAGAVAVVPPSCGAGKRAAARALLARL